MKKALGQEAGFEPDCPALFCQFRAVSSFFLFRFSFFVFEPTGSLW